MPSGSRNFAPWRHLFAEVVPHLFEFGAKRSPILPIGLLAVDLLPRQLEFEREVIRLQGCMKQRAISRREHRDLSKLRHQLYQCVSVARWVFFVETRSSRATTDTGPKSRSITV